MIIKEFLDPESKIKLNKDNKGNLYCLKGRKSIVYPNHDGIFNFVSEKKLAGEIYHYDNKYGGLTTRRLTLHDVSDEWYDKIAPENIVLLECLGNLAGKKVLLLGNGNSIKELYFIKLGAKVVYTDLSIEAVKYMRTLFFSSELRRYHKNIEFHAVDALHLPFPDASFDIIYGCAFVHHIEDLYPLFTEISRCLKEDGICRFLDDAYSPVWHFVKNTVFKLLQSYSHKKTGISPEDLKATKKGGYKKDELLQLMHYFEFKELVFERTSFFQYLWRRGITKLLNEDKFLIRKGMPIMAALDHFLIGESHLIRGNLLRLIWGFNK